MDCIATSAGKSSQPALEFFIDITVCLTSANVTGGSTMLLMQLLIYDIGLLLLLNRIYHCLKIVLSFVDRPFQLHNV